MQTARASVKLLDFGLARVLREMNLQPTAPASPEKGAVISITFVTPDAREHRPTRAMTRIYRIRRCM